MRFLSVLLLCFPTPTEALCADATCTGMLSALCIWPNGSSRRDEILLAVYEV